MRNSSTTQQPKLSSSLLVKGDPELVKVLRQIESEHGGARVVQDEKGRMTPVRVNTQTARMEFFDGKQWREMGQGSAVGGGGPTQGETTTVVETQMINQQQVFALPARYNKGAYFGDVSSGNYSQFEDDGTLVMQGNATVWEDIRVPITSVKTRGVADPGFTMFKNNATGAPTTGVYIYWFDKTTEEELFFTVQMPHDWKQGTTIYPHVHWVPKTTDSGTPADKVVCWGLEWTWCDVDEVFPAMTEVRTEDSVSGLVADTHVMTQIDSISGADHTISSMLLCRLFRSADSISDTYNDDAGLLEIDFHYEIDTLGSRTATSK